jgi:hypothetical protein
MEEKQRAAAPAAASVFEERHFAGALQNGGMEDGGWKMEDGRWRRGERES